MVKFGTLLKSTFHADRFNGSMLDRLKWNNGSVAVGMLSTDAELIQNLSKSFDIFSSAMSNLGNANVGTTLFQEFKRQASFFLKEKLKTARLALTDVTSAQLLTEEATNGDPCSPDTRTMGLISRAAFEVDDYWRIVEILHKRLERFDKKNWRVSYKALIVLEHLLTHGPESIAEEFQSDKNVIEEMGNFQHTDDTGFNWSLTVRRKSERILRLLERGPLLKEERDRARKLTRGIKGFGSFSLQSSSPPQEILKESSLAGTFGRCSSEFNIRNKEIPFPSDDGDSASIQTRAEWSLQRDENVSMVRSEKMEESESLVPGSRENLVVESKPLLGGHKAEDWIAVYEEDHPFNEDDSQTTASLLLPAGNKISQPC